MGKRKESYYKKKGGVFFRNKNRNNKQSPSLEKDNNALSCELERTHSAIPEGIQNEENLNIEIKREFETAPEGIQNEENVNIAISLKCDFETTTTDTIVFKVEDTEEEYQLQCPEDPVPDELNLTPVLEPVIQRHKARPKKEEPVSKVTKKYITRTQVREAREKKEEIQRRRREAAAQRINPKSAKTAMLTDECQVYANLLATELRRYSERTRNLLQHEITNLVMVAEDGYQALAQYELLSSLQRAAPIIYGTESTAHDELNLTEVDDMGDINM